ncbi:hypothetical protein O3M35_001906 [Rhynocoris fuscipes]|uniref:Peptidase S1 domain-containing protein n=1 Tax=Rhynocoris fuscipes TaxID=488301 RepID=A0AAW1CST6_9HEMI
MLEEPLVFNKVIKRVSIEHNPWPEGLDRYARVCFTLGFGKSSRTRKKGTLHGNKVTVEHGDKACGCVTDSILIKKRIVCLNNLGNDRICYGDMGAPIICDSSLVGVAHMIAKCQNFTSHHQDIIECGKESVIDVFTYVYPVLEWINSFVPSSSTKKHLGRSASLVRSGTDRLHTFSITKLIIGGEIDNNNNFMFTADCLIHTIILYCTKWIL